MTCSASAPAGKSSRGVHAPPEVCCSCTRACSTILSFASVLVACGTTAEPVSTDVSPAFTVDGYTNFADDGIAPQALTLEGNWPIIRVKVNGADYGFLLDTGAQGTMINLNSFPDLERVETLLDVNLEVFGREFGQHSVGTMDFEGPGWFGIDGILGADILAQYIVTLDYQGQQAWLSEDPEAPLAGFNPNKIATTSVHSLTPGDRGWKEVEFNLESVSAVLLVDTGASITVVSTQLLEPLDPDGRPAVTGGVLASGTQTVHTRLRTASIGTDDTQIENFPLHAFPYSAPPYDEGLLGTTFLRHFLTTIDGPGNRLVLSRYKDDSHIDPNEFVGLGFQLRAQGGHFFVQGMFDGGPAAAALQLGDEILSIGELPLAGTSRGALYRALSGYTPGETVEVTVVRGEEEFRVELVAQVLLPNIDVD